MSAVWRENSHPETELLIKRKPANFADVIINSLLYGEAKPLRHPRGIQLQACQSGMWKLQREQHSGRKRPSRKKFVKMETQ